jgi:biotin-(acetyl-CoA carboxylase) ligase
MNQSYDTFMTREEEMWQSIHEAALKHAKVTNTVCDEFLENMKKWLNLWIQKMFRDFLKTVYLDSIVVRPKPEEISHII